VPKTYDVALSFAGEDREYVEKIATELRDAGVSVFYDTFQRAELWGKNLVDHLAEIYQKRSRYVVMFISKPYVEMRGRRTSDNMLKHVRFSPKRNTYFLRASTTQRSRG